MNISYKIYDETKPFKEPNYADQGCSGLDLYSSNNENIILEPGEFKLIDTNVSVEIPDGYEAQVRSKSGLALKRGVFVLNSPGTVDSSYRGSVGVILMNLSKNPFIIEPFTKIAQLVFAKVEIVQLIKKDVLSNTNRGSGGFGSTGIK